MNFQDIILTLQKYWAERGCNLVQPYDLEMGAGTFHPATFLAPWVLNPVPSPTPNPVEDRKMDAMAKIRTACNTTTSFR